MPESPSSGESRRPVYQPPLVLALLVAFPSAGFVQKYAGIAGLCAYGLMVIAVFLFIARYGARAEPWIKRHFRVLTVLAFTGLVAGYVVLHPIEDNKGPGKSSDRDEGLELAVSRMIDGRTPYYPSNTVAGPLSVLPGSILLAFPFAACGQSGYQNLIWLAALLFAFTRRFRSRSLALCLLAVPLGLSPACLYELVSGGDLLANGIFVAVLSAFALSRWRDPSAPPFSRWMSCLLLGVGLASRANFVLLLPLFGAFVWQAAGFRQAVLATLVTAITAAALTLPFYLHDPAGFTPLLTRQKLAIADRAIPWASSAMIAISAVVSLLCGWRMLRNRRADPGMVFFRCCTLVTLTPMVCVVVLASWFSGHADFSFMKDRFGLMYVFFALLGWGGQWFVRDAEAGKINPAASC